MSSSATAAPMPPFVSIIIPVYNDAEHIREALQSCFDQTDQDYEIVAVDDCSTDGTFAILQEIATTHPKVRVIRQAENATAFQARRAGVLASHGRYLMFLDGDDSLAPGAVAGVRRMAGSSPDLIHFGCSIVGRDGRHHPGFEAKLSPGRARLGGRAIFDDLFLLRDTFEGHLWNKAYRAEFATPLFAALPETLRVPRANDLPVSLMLAVRAKTYVATKDKLYSYFFGSGGITDISITTDRFITLANFRPSYDVIASEIIAWGLSANDAARVLATVRSQFIARSVRLLMQVAAVSGAELETLLAQWPAAEVLGELFGRFEQQGESILPFLMQDPEGRETKPRGPVQTVGLYLDQPGIGGMQRVTSLQAKLLSRHGYKVVLLARMHRDEYTYRLPDSSEFVSLVPHERATHDEALRHLLSGIDDAVRVHGIDTIIVHANYRPELIYLAVGLRHVPVRSILTVHSFALRAIFDRSPRFEHLRAAARQLDCLAVLSTTDEVFWRLAGVRHACYVPNPVSFELDGATDGQSITGARTGAPDSSGRASGETCDVLWFGRLDERVKRVSEVLRIFALLHEQRPGVRLHIVGPIGRGERGVVQSLKTLAHDLGVADAVSMLPETADIAALLSSTKVVLNTSIVEGFGYALVEPLIASRPVVMYDLPYLEVPKGNAGITIVPWGNREAAAGAIRELLDDPELRMSRATSGLATLHDRFSDEKVLERLTAAFDAAAGVTHPNSPDAPDAEEDLAHARVVVQQLFPLYQASLSARVAGAAAPSVEAFYRTWHGSRTIRWSEQLGRPIHAARRAVRRVVRRVGSGPMLFNRHG